MPTKTTYTIDPKQAGLAVRVDTSDDGSTLSRWCFRKQIAGRRHYLTCPIDFRPPNIADARAWARRVTAEIELGQSTVVRQVRVSTAQKRGTKAVVADMTLAELLTAYCGDKTKTTRDNATVNLSDRYVSDVMRLVQAPRTRESIDLAIAAGDKSLTTRQVRGAGTLYHLRDKKLSALTAEALRDWYDGVLERAPVDAGRSAAIVKAALAWIKFPSDRNPFLPTHPLYKPLRKAGVAKAQLWASDLRAFWQAIETVGADYPEHQAYLKFLLLTCKRPAEPLQCLVSDFNPMAKTLVLRQMKSRVAHTIYLSSQALAIVQAQVAGKKQSAKLFDVLDTALLLDKINASMGTSYTPKDLRKVAAAIAMEVLPLHRVQALMDHAATSTLERNYVNGDEQAQKAWQALGDEIDRLVN
jgi:integrase